MSKYTKGDVVFMKASSGMMGYGNAQCISEVHCEQLGTISLYGHNQHYKTYDIARIVDHARLIAAAPTMYSACLDMLKYLDNIACDNKAEAENKTAMIRIINLAVPEFTI